MGLEDRLLEDYTNAMKAQNRIALETVRMVRAAIKNASLEKRSPLSEEEVSAVLSREVKRRKESLEMYEKGGRKDLAEKEAAEIEIISAYLPKALSEAELEDIIVRTIQEVGASGAGEMGKVMAAVMPQVKGRAEGKLIQELVRKKLG
jgi:uncharacterized protein YqeY